MADYIYSIENTLTNGLNIICLDKTIREYGFEHEFNGVTNVDDIIKISFSSSLGTGEKIELDNLISIHDPNNCSQESDFGTIIGVAEDAESLSLSSTNSNVAQRKLRLNLNNLIEGRYRIGWYYEWYHSLMSADFRARVQINDSIDLMYHSQESKDSGNDQSTPVCGFGYYNFLQGNHSIDLDYWSESGTSYIKNVRIEIWRVL